MKKKIIAMILSGTMLFSLCACSGEKSEVSSEPATGSVATKTEAESSVQEESVAQDTYARNDYYLWVTTLEKGEQKMPTTLFDERLTVPLTEESLNTLGAFEDNHTDLTTILDAPMEMWGSELARWNDERIDEENEGNGINALYVINPNYENPLTLREAFDQGYWCIEESYSTLSSVLGVEEKEMWNDETKQWDQFNSIVEMLGSPSYVAKLRETDADGNEVNFTFDDYDKVIDEAFVKEEEAQLGQAMVGENYQLVYEYEDFVLVIAISEIFAPGEGERTIASKVQGISYYPMEGWNNYFKEGKCYPVILELE